MQESNPFIPDHELRASFLGRWYDSKMLAYHIDQLEDGRVIFRDIDFNGWTVVINRVQWEGDMLCFNQYHYAPKSHPFDGVENVFRISMTDKIGKLWFETRADEIGQSACGELVSTPE